MTRMSDFFELPVAAEAFVDMDANIAVSESIAIAHAINQHDKLLDLLTYAVKHTTIDTTSHEQMKWFIDAFELLEGEL